MSPERSPLKGTVHAGGNSSFEGAISESILRWADLSQDSEHDMRGLDAGPVGLDLLNVACSEVLRRMLPLN